MVDPVPDVGLAIEPEPVAGLAIEPEPVVGVIIESFIVGEESVPAGVVIEPEPVDGDAVMPDVAWEPLPVVASESESSSPQAASSMAAGRTPTTIVRRQLNRLLRDMRDLLFHNLVDVQAVLHNDPRMQHVLHFDM